MAASTPPTADQIAALRAYARHHGRTWKAALRADWMDACQSVDPQIAGLLQQLRNTHGPAWLVAFRLDDGTATCPECGRVFDLLSAAEAAEV